MPEVPPPEVSPTGQAVFPQWVARLGVTLAGLGTTALAALAMFPDETPWKAKAMAGATVAIGVGALLGGGSPGLRKTGTDAAAKVQTTQDVVDVLNRPGPQP